MKALKALGIMAIGALALVPVIIYLAWHGFRRSWCRRFHRGQWHYTPQLNNVGAACLVCDCVYTKEELR